MALKILIVGLTVFVAHFFVLLFKKFRLPDVLLLMLAGIVAGPALHLVGPGDFGVVGPVATSIALIVILFEGGVNLNLKTIFKALHGAFVITLLGWVVTAGTVAWVMYALTPLGWVPSVMTGAILGGTSSAVVIPMINACAMKEEPRTILFLESALTDVLCIVAAVGLLEAALLGEVNAGRMAGRILASFGAATAIGAAGGFVWAAILGKVRRFPNTIFTTVAYVFLLYGAAELLGFSGAIAALAFGISLANLSGLNFSFGGRKILALRKVSRVDRLFFSEAVFLLKTFFFIYLGISLRFDRIMYILLGLVMVGVVYMERFMIVRLAASRKFTRRDASIMTAMAPKGLAAAVLASLPAQHGLSGASWIENVAYMVVLISIVATSLLVLMIDKTPLKRAYFGVFKGFAPVEEEAPAAAAPLPFPVPPAPAPEPAMPPETSGACPG